MLESVPMLSSGITVDVIGSQCRCENDSIWWTDTPILIECHFGKVYPA